MRERIMDANLNRLCEGLRVIEDIARFGLDDAALAGPVKAMRLEAGRLRQTLAGGLLTARDSLGDVGRLRIKEPERRADLAAVLGASFGRVAESLRVLEELAKLTEGGAAARAKALRYQSYELEKQLLPLVDRRQRAARLRGLYLVMSAPRVGHERLTEMAIAAGVAAIQLREKNWEGGRILELARRLRAMTRGTATMLFINDRPDIARLCEADGVHLGQGDLAVADARRIAGERMLVGKSTHNPAQLRAARAEQPDYVGIGPVFGTASKAIPDPVLGLKRAGAMRRQAGVPAVAIGGLGGGNLAQIFEQGFTCYALITHVGQAEDPLKVMRRLKRLERAAGIKCV